MKIAKRRETPRAAQLRHVAAMIRGGHDPLRCHRCRQLLGRAATDGLRRVALCPDFPATGNQPTNGTSHAT